MNWTAQQFDDQPSDFINDLLYYYRSQNIISQIENAEFENLLSILRQRNDNPN